MGDDFSPRVRPRGDFVAGELLLTLLGQRRFRLGLRLVDLGLEVAAGFAVHAVDEQDAVQVIRLAKDVGKTEATP